MTYAKRYEEVRRAAREEVCYRCLIQGATSPSTPGLIVNISPLGCMIRCSAEPAFGTIVHFELPQVGTVQGRVMWAIGARMGVEFDTQMPLEPYLAMLGDMSHPGDEMGIY